jgi:hypothetical protein
MERMTAGEPEEKAPPESRWTRVKNKVKRPRVWLGLGLGAGWGLYSALEAADIHVPAGLRDALLALAAVMAVTFIERELSLREFERWHAESERRLERAVADALATVQDTVTKGQNSFSEYLAESDELMATARACSLEAIWPRRSAAVPAILEAVRNARSRVWLLGVAFAEGLTLDALTNAIAEGADNGTEPDFRVLLMDPLQSPAVYRTLLESADLTLDQIIRCERPDSLDPLLRERHYPAFSRNISILRRRPDADRIVRFYGQNPTCWMMICDDEVFYEPYTLGVTRTAETSGLCIGSLMPVFKYRAGADSVFEMLEDHFRKVWLTSDTGLIHAEARLRRAKEIYARMFEPDERGMWFEYVAGSLRASRARPSEFADTIDPRRVPRHRCTWGGSVMVEGRNKMGGTLRAAATIRDYSENGIGIVFLGGHERFMPNREVTVSVLEPAGAVPIDPEATAEVRRLLGGQHAGCQIEWRGKDGSARAGLRFTPTLEHEPSIASAA